MLSLTVARRKVLYLSSEVVLNVSCAAPPNDVGPEEPPSGVSFAATSAGPAGGPQKLRALRSCLP